MPRHPKRVLGLPLQLAVIYSIVFAAAVLIYPAAWPDAPLVAPDTQGYVAFARDLRDGVVDELHARAPGLPVLLLLTSATGEPRRSLPCPVGAALHRCLDAGAIA